MLRRACISLAVLSVSAVVRSLLLLLCSEQCGGSVSLRDARCFICRPRAKHMLLRWEGSIEHGVMWRMSSLAADTTAQGRVECYRPTGQPLGTVTGACRPAQQRVCTAPLPAIQHHRTPALTAKAAATAAAVLWHTMQRTLVDRRVLSGCP